MIRQSTDRLGIAFSGGKDSHVVLDLAAATFPRLYGYYLYRVGELKFIDKICRRAEKRWSIKILYYPHFDLYRCYKNAIFQPHWKATDEVPKITMKDVEQTFRADTGVTFIAYGWRRTDSLSRALIMKSCHGIDLKAQRIYPIWQWRRSDVFSYLKIRNIPRPPALGRQEQGGADFHPEALRWLRDNYPDDYDKFIKEFPYAEIQTLANDKFSAL